MKEILLIKCGELVLKGLNRYRFEHQLVRTLKRRLQHVGQFRIHANQSTLYVEPMGENTARDALDIAQKLFGVVTIQPAAMCVKDMDAICQMAGEYLQEAMACAATFKVEARRSDKRFPLTSPEISAQVGGHLAELFPHCKPKMNDPELTIKVEIREEYAFISGQRLSGAGGMPTGTNGRGMLLLSGGIDSPVAGWMMAKRGLELSAVHFFSYPYTSEEAKEKVFDLAGILAQWCGRITVNVVPFTKIQLAINEKCHEDYSTLLMRRFMMRLAERIARNQGCEALVTGESLGQVASQTIQSLACTDAVCGMPVFRPVIGMDKEEIVQIARRIDTFETSILPFEDCCTVFTPRHPQTKPKLENVEREEARLDVEALIEEALTGVEQIVKRIGKDRQ